MINLLLRVIVVDSNLFDIQLIYLQFFILIFFFWKSRIAKMQPHLLEICIQTKPFVTQVVYDDSKRI